jgi:hypothetical protein
MEERESNQIRQVTSDFGNVKSTIDTQILQDSNFIVASPITLGTEGFAMFGADSTGTFSINHFRNDELEYYCNIQNTSGDVNVTATGGMKYQSNNQFFVDQELAYENGAIILDQGGGEIMRIGPQFTIEKFGPVVKLSFVLITISGIETSIQGTSTVLFQTQLITYTEDTYLFIPAETVTITMITEYPTGWSRYLENSLIDAGLVPAVDYDITVGDTDLLLDIHNIQFFELGYALIKSNVEM